MNISYNWLKKYIDIDLAPVELSENMTKIGLEVEAMESTGSVPEGVVTAKILTRKPHENSDHLSVCTVDKGDEVLQIVCGAPNCDAGCIVPLATIGTTFKDGNETSTIKKGKIRGVESFGMMCSERELGLSENHDGLMILPADTKLGIPMSSLVKGDTFYDCSVTPNRPDWLCHIGVARDLAALLGKPLLMPDTSSAPADGSVPVVDGLVTVQAPDLCPLYAARVIRGVKVGPSPDWMKDCLKAVGIRAINNIVDITNFVMMEYGVPLHAFDIRNLKDGKIIVRRAVKGESIVALDGKKYDLAEDNLCICDAEKPVAIAGVMGGEYSGVQDDTSVVVLESAFFNPASIRATSRKIGLASDASYRYERGVDREAVLAAGHRAMQLILDLAGGEFTGYCSVEAEKTAPRVIPLCCQFVRNLIGIDISDERQIEILKSLGFTSNDNVNFTVPPWRIYDVMEKADLAEEIVRIYGLDKLPDVPVYAKAADYRMDGCKVLETLHNQLNSIGLDEIVCGSLLDEKDVIADGIFDASDVFTMTNPISLDLAFIRPSLLAGVLKVVRYNIARKNCDLALFEIGHVFCKNPEKFPEERDELVIALTGRVHPERYSGERAALYDFYDLKGAVEALMNIRRIKSFTFRPGTDRRFIPGRCAELVICGKTAGVFGEIVPTLVKGMRLTTPLFAAVIQLEGLLSAVEKSILYEPVSQFPPVSRDVAFLAPKDLEHKKVIDFISKAHLPNLERVELFDIFEDDKTLGADRKSMAYSLIFRSADRTLTDDEVNKTYELLRQKLAKGLGVELR